MLLNHCFTHLRITCLVFFRQSVRTVEMDSFDSVLQVKPRRDPCQQKLLTELKEKQSVDGLLRKHCRFLQVTRIRL